MKIYYQAATNVPRDWVQVEHTNWADTPVKADPQEPRAADGYPTGDSLLNNTGGWIFDLNVQGVTFGTNDHAHVAAGANGSAVVTVWNDDSYWYPAGFRNAAVWTFQTLGENTMQTHVDYAEGSQWEQWQTQQPGQGQTFAHLDTFVPPTGAGVRHGIWVSDAKWAQLLNRQTLKGFRDSI